MSAEFTGRWVLRGGIRVPVIEPQPEPKRREPPKPADPVGVLIAETVWTDEALTEAHRRHWHGFRDAWTLAGNKEWDRRRKAATRARLRAGGLSAVDRAWCERAAVRGSWVLDTRTNRASVANTITGKGTTMTDKQKILEFIKQNQIDIQENSTKTELNVNLWTPPGKVWEATGGHSLTLHWFTEKTRAWTTLWADVQMGLSDCEEPNCEGCLT